MKKNYIRISVVVLLLILVTLSLIQISSCKNCDVEEKNLKVIEVTDWLKLSQLKDVIILDVRTLKEFEEFHLDKAINLDFYDKNHKLNLEKLDKNKTYLTYCRSGRRSGLNLEIMKELGFTSVYDMEGGILAYNKFIDAQKS